MGLTFKENCADVRNSGIESVIKKLNKLNCNIDLYDPWVDRAEIKKNNYEGIIIAVGHKKFKQLGIKNIKKLCKKKHVIYDLKYLFPKNQVDLRL